MLTKKQKGVSLVELILYIAIVSIMLGAIIPFFSSNRKMADRNNAVSEVDSQASQIMRLILQSIRNSKIINSPNAGMQAASLSLESDISSENPTIFDVSTNKIRIKEGTGAAVNLNSDKVIVSNLSFFNLSNSGTRGSIAVEFEIQYLNPSGEPELNYMKKYYGSASLR